MKIRTRIAPSPTGDPHLGTVYIALFNYCFAKSQNGQFILRIEDTDTKRSSIQAEKKIIEALNWLNIKPDESQEAGGKFAPYKQSLRQDIYKKYALELVEKDHAFYCFASQKELDDLKNQQLQNKERPKYDGRGLLLSKEEIKENLAKKIPYVIRMKIPTGQFTFNDYLRGEITIDWENIDMQVLLKQDGMPTYFLANVVDDHLMQISHIFRGEEWISSAPKLLKLYEYFGWKAPILGHLPLLRNPDQSKLSKRKNPTSVLFYKRLGYMPQALLNYLGRMGWSMPDEREKFSLSQMIENFDIKRVSLGGPVFDIDKLNWLNNLWLKENLNDEEFINFYQKWQQQIDLKKLVPLLKPRINNLSQISSLVNHLYQDKLNICLDDFLFKDLEQEDVIKIIQFIFWSLSTLENFSRDDIFFRIKTIATHLDIKLKLFMKPLFISITGTQNSFSVIDSIEIIGRELSCFRLQNVILNIFNISKKQKKSLEKNFKEIKFN